MRLWSHTRIQIRLRVLYRRFLLFVGIPEGKERKKRMVTMGVMMGRTFWEKP